MALAVSIAVAPPCTLDSRPLRSSISRSWRPRYGGPLPGSWPGASRRAQCQMLAAGGTAGRVLRDRDRISCVSTLKPTGGRPVSAADIDAAARRISGVASLTPLEECQRLSAETDTTVLLNREDLQLVRSYKLRGAYNLMAQLTPEERAAGVVCASAGNHAQGVAFACRALDIKGRIYLPNTTPRQKRDRILSHGAGTVELVMTGDTFDDAAAAAAVHAAESGAVMVAPFDDPRTIAGQGTVVRELLQQLGRAPDVIVVPVGGGGLIAGIVTYLRERAPRVRIIGAEPAGAPSMIAAMDAGGPIALDTLDPFVDGA